MEKTHKDPDAHLASLPAGVREDMERLDALITEAMPGRSRTLWEGTFWGGSEQQIIAYGDLNQERPAGTVEWFMVGLAAQKNYISMYVNAASEGGYAVQEYAARLGKVKVGSASISFKKLADIDLVALTELVSLANGQLDG
jgi:Domain of unknown function (DU1801)